ncbi:MAG: protein BatD [Elusimicrobiaceae bacterium]|nr:protein BatD [Elusimicrobiaceae bacterium]
MRKTAFLLFVLMSLTIGAWAQVSFSAQTDKTALALDDELTLTVHLSGVTGNIVAPQLPSLPAFNVYSREMEQASINGRTSLLFRYTMVPRFVGNATIGPVTFTYNGQTYKTQPIAVQIFRDTNGNHTRGGANTQATSTGAGASSRKQNFQHLPPLQATLAKLADDRAGEPFFLVAAVNNRSPYVNESVTLAVRFYYSRNFYDAPYQKPTVSNIFMEEDGKSEGSQNIGGTRYQYEEQRYQLAAAQPGKATIGPATVHYKTGSSPFSAFDRLFGGAAVSAEKTARSNPITLSVRPLPKEGQPASFSGAVGNNFSLKAQASPEQVEAGEAVNLSVTVQGPGNLKATRDLDFPPVDGFKIYPAAATSGLAQGKNGTSIGYKIFKAVFVPAASGIYTLPSFKWSYFDPTSATYKTLQSDPISLTVTPTSKNASGVNFAAEGNPTGGFQALSNDIMYLKTDLGEKETFLAQISRWWLLNWLLAGLLIAGALFTTLGKKSLSKKKAFLTAKTHLKKASGGQEVADAISTYLQQRFDISTGSLPLRDMALSLHRKGVRAETVKIFVRLWQRLEEERFAPATLTSANTGKLAANALEILAQMEKEIK